DLHAAPPLRLRLDSVRIGQAAARFERVESSFQGIAARKSKDGIDAIRRKMGCRPCNVLMPAVHCKIGTQASYQLDAIHARRGCKHARPAKLGKLDGERSNAARRSVDDHSLVLLEMERVINPLECGEPRRRDRASMLEVKRLGNGRDLLC